MAKLLETRSLTKRFGGVTAIDNLDFGVDEGGVHCLIGPNGAGKSTLFKLIVGRITPTEGSIWFRGRDITALPTSERIRAGISIKMQVPGIFPELPVAQNLTIALQRHHSRVETRREVERLLDFAELSNDAAKPAGQLAFQMIVEGASGRPQIYIKTRLNSALAALSVEASTRAIKRLNRSSNGTRTKCCCARRSNKVPSMWQ